MLLETNIKIKATKETVWNALFESDLSWSPFLKTIDGDKTIGSTLKVEMLLDGKFMKFTPKVLRSIRNEEFVWLGDTFVKGIFDGEHYFKIEEDENRNVNFIHNEKFSGLLAPLFNWLMFDKTKAAFLEMNKALKNYCEK